MARFLKFSGTAEFTIDVQRPGSATNDVSGAIHTPANWSEGQTLAGFSSAVAAPLAYINAEDPDVVTYVVDETSVRATSITDKTANAHDFSAGNCIYTIRNGRNVLKFSSPAEIESATLGAALAGAGFDNPAVIAIPVEITNYPSSTVTVACFGSATTSVFRTIDITSDGYVSCSWKDDSANTGAVTGSQAIQLNTPTLIVVQHERERYRVWLQDGDTYTSELAASGSSSTGDSFTFDQFVLGAKLDSGSASQHFDGYISGLMVLDSVVSNSYTLIEQLCRVWPVVGHVPLGLSTIDANLVSHITFDGPAGDHADTLAGSTLSSTNGAVGAGVFGNALNTDGTSRDLSGTMTAAHDLTNKLVFMLFMRFQPKSAGSGTAAIYLEAKSASGVGWSIGTTTANKIEVIRNHSDRLTQEDDRYTTSPVLDAWNYFFLFSYDGVTWELLVNNFQDSDFNHITVTGGLWSMLGETTPKLYIGSDGAGANDANALIDEIAIWNRVLTEEEREILVNGGSYRRVPWAYTKAADGPVVVDPPPSSGTTQEFFWGPQMGCCTGPANEPLKDGTYSIVFTVPPSSVIGSSATTLTDIAIWWKTSVSSGYSKGTEPWIYDIELRTDSGGNPGSLVTNGRISGASITFANQKLGHTWSSPPTVSAGTKYHIQLVNKASDPRTQWTSINNLLAWPNIFSRVQPTRSADEWSLRVNGSTKIYTPMAMLSYSSGTRQGCGYVDGWVARGDRGSGETGPIISGDTWVRQILKPDEDIVVKRLFVSGARKSGSFPMIAQLKDSGGILLATAEIAAENYPEGETLPRTARGSTLNYYTGHWGDAALSTEVTLAGGQTYYLELRTDSNTQYYICVLHDAAHTSANFPNDGKGRYGGYYGMNAYMQQSTNAGSSWGQFKLYASDTVPKYDIGFYFRVGTGDGGTSGSTAWTPSSLSGTTVMFDVTDSSSRSVSGAEITQLTDTIGGSITADRPTPVDATDGGPQLATGSTDYAHFDPAIRTRARLDVSSSVACETAVIVTRGVPYSSSFLSIYSTSGGGTFTGELMLYETTTSIGQANTTSIDGTSSSTGQVRINGGSWSSTGTNPAFAGSAYYPETGVNIISVKMATGTNTMNVLGPRDGFNTLEHEAICYVFNSTAQSDVEIEKIEGYLAHRFGATLASGHTYEFAPPTV